LSSPLGRVAAAGRAWSSYSGAPPATRAFLLARLAILPLGSLDPELRALRGRVLSVGAGHGLLERYLAEINAGVTVDGLELDEDRVRVANATAGRAPRVRIRAADVRTLDGAADVDAVLAVDVLHHLDAGAQAELLDAAAERLTPGGVLLVKDIARTPRWRWAVNRLHDRIVAGPDPITCREPEEMAALAARAGLQVEDVRRLPHPSPYPHYLVRARRNAIVGPK
jgi:cyclopropane fatty-acyl-phospholipid synthase-like methyltransferase